MKAELVPENGDPPIPILKDLTIIGRRSFCDVVIDHPSLSKRHAVVVKTDGLLVIRDLATTNGTKVKGQRIRWAALLPDDRIALGGCKFRVYLGPDDVPSPSELPNRARSKNVPSADISAKLPSPAPCPEVGFPSPSPLEVPVPVDVEEVDDKVDILEDNGEPDVYVDDDDENDVSADSGWRRMFNNNAGNDPADERRFVDFD